MTHDTFKAFLIKMHCFLNPRFDPHFDPEKHNVWLKRYVQAAEKKELNELEEWSRLQEMKRRRSCIHFVPFSWKLCILESVIIGSLLSIVPLAVLLVEIIFQE